jgi:hypothetical protein
MNKLMHSMFAAAALLAAGAVMAQDGGAECQGAASSGGRPGCGAGPTVPYPTAGVPVTPPPGVYYSPYAYRDYGRYAYGPQYQHPAQPAYPYTRPSRRDRDGDGVPNRNDRYPYDPSRY